MSAKTRKSNPSQLTRLISRDCEDCGGTGTVGDDPCDCVLKYHNRLLDAGIPERFRNCDLDTINWPAYSAQESIQGIRAYAERFEQYADQGLGLWLYGPPGIGKTHIAVGIGKLACALRMMVVFVNIPTWLEEMKSSFDNKAAYTPSVQRLNKLAIHHRERTCTLLVLDDLGIENPTLWVREEIYHLVNQQYGYGDPMVVTSNISPDDMVPDSSQSHGHAAGTISRLAGTCLLAPIEGEDYRLRQKREAIKAITQETP